MVAIIIFSVYTILLIVLAIMLFYDWNKPRVSVPLQEILEDPTRLDQIYNSITEKNFINAYGKEKGLRLWNLYLLAKSNGKSMRSFLTQLSKYEGQKVFSN